MRKWRSQLSHVFIHDVNNMVSQSQCRIFVLCANQILTFSWCSLLYFVLHLSVHKFIIVITRISNLSFAHDFLNVRLPAVYFAVLNCKCQQTFPKLQILPLRYLIHENHTYQINAYIEQLPSLWHVVWQLACLRYVSILCCIVRSFCGTSRWHCDM